MKTFASKNTYTQNSFKEHTPIYDLDAYERRQHQFKRKYFIKSIIDSVIFFFSISIVLSCLFVFHF